MGKFSIPSQTRHILGPKIAKNESQFSILLNPIPNSQMLNAMDIYLHLDLPLKVAKL